jgi:lipopolysaccharide/colanic/teichoic acid biosynthesis glycosyltransferase
VRSSHCRSHGINAGEKGWVVLMAKSRTGHDRSRQSEKSLPEPVEGYLSLKASAESMFCPRYVSSWCMSKRKRCFDLVLSLIALILFSPMMLLIAWLIKVTSHGPALFRQERVGLHQQMFVILKFRTMHNRSDLFDSGPTVTRHGDSRMTNVGALLRRLKLDELPQLINVVRGDMSFVGPRPKIAQHENLCMLCRPGITGAATIEFSHEEGLLRNVPDEFVERYVTTVLNPEKCKLDIQYIETTKFGTDLKILVNTVFKLSNRSRRTFSAESARFLTARSSMENSSIARNSAGDGDFSPQDVRQSA